MERLSKKHLARKLQKHTTFFKSFFIRNVFSVYNKSYAFTLAEVLISLGIIGIVAALTLPTITVKKRNLELESSFKTAYSLISQAVLRMSVDNSNIAETYCEPRDLISTKFAEDFSKYFQITKIQLYPKPTDLTQLGYKQQNFLQANGKADFNDDVYNNGVFFIKNGMMIANSGCWWLSATPAVDFMIDTNGIKGPNRFGYDVFYFQINNKNILLPSTQKYTFTVIESQLKECCNLTGNSTCAYTQDNGTACSHFALKNRNPQDETQPYWKSLH